MLTQTAPALLLHLSLIFLTYSTLLQKRSPYLNQIEEDDFLDFLLHKCTICTTPPPPEAGHHDIYLSALKYKRVGCRCRSHIMGVVASTLCGGFADPKACKSMVMDGAQLIDVRTGGEFEGGSIPQAKNIPVSSLTTRMSEIKKDAGPVVVFCKSGLRSAKAKSMLEKNGYSEVHNLGPMSAWPRD